MDTPKRKIETVIKISADDTESLIAALNQLVFEARIDRFPISSVSGGYSWGWIVETQTNEAQTHDAWASELNLWLEDSRRKKLEAEPHPA